MSNLVLFFIIIQMLLLFMIGLHDWIHIPPLTDIAELKKYHSIKDRLITSSINISIVIIPLLLTWYYRDFFPYWTSLVIALFYGFLTFGTLFAWWIPYFFGSSESHKDGFAEYRNTHHFLPTRGDNVIPNSLHVILHLQIWFCFALSLFLLM